MKRLRTRPPRRRTNPPCSANGCTRQSEIKTLCSMHYARMKRLGALTLPDKKPSRGCGVDGCKNQYRSAGYCNMHRLRLSAKAELGGVEPIKAPNGKGTIHDGYRYKYEPDHPNARANGNVSEHVLVMSRKIGRALKKGESVHHKNGFRSDNSDGNLELWCKPHPAGQRVTDMIAFCRAFLAEYEAVGEDGQRSATTILLPEEY